MNKTELKRLAKQMASFCLRELAENETAIENGIEVFAMYLEDEEVAELSKAIQEIAERLVK